MLHPVRDAVLDLLLGASCLGCAGPGRVLCGACARTLPRGARPAWPRPSPPGLATPWAVAEYDGLVKAMVVGHKEHRLLALTAPLGLLLADAAAAAVVARGPVVLVPVPSRRASVRSRGHDPTRAVTARAAGLLRHAGHDAVSLALLCPRPGVVDQAGLGAEERSHNLAGAMACPTRSLRRLAAIRPRAHVVVCDDVITTGATAREAQRALEAVGLTVVGVAAVAATRRRLPPPAGGGESHSQSSGLWVSPGSRTR